MIFTYIAWILLVLGFYVLHSDYETLPDQVPLKYNFDGSIQSQGPKRSLYLLVVVGFMVGVLMTGLLFTEGAEEVTLVLESTHLLTQLLFTYMIYQTIKVAKGHAKGLGKVFYILIISVIVLPLFLAFQGK